MARRVSRGDHAVLGRRGARPGGDDRASGYADPRRGARPGDAWHRGRELLAVARGETRRRSEEHTSELQSLMRISYAVFCLQKKKIHKYIILPTTNVESQIT